MKTLGQLIFGPDWKPRTRADFEQAREARERVTPAVESNAKTLEFSPDGKWVWNGASWQPVPNQQIANVRTETMVREYRSIFGAGNQFAKDAKKLSKQGWSVLAQSGTGVTGVIVVTYTRAAR